PSEQTETLPDKSESITLHLTVHSYWPLACLLILPYVWWIQRRTRSHISSRHLLVCTAVRSTIVLMLIASLMQPFVDRQAEPLSIVYALDISRSVAPSAIQSALNWIQKANSIGRPAHERFIAFGGNSAVFENLEQ